MSDLTEVQTWRRLLGYLPVPLFGTRDEQAYVLLNGGKGNFCLDVGETTSDEAAEAASRAWSSDVDHYVRISGDHLMLTRWDQPEKSERLSIRSVRSKVQLFHEYLASRQAPRERSVVTRAIQSFRAVRAQATAENDARALMAFIGVLCTAWTREDSHVNLPERWSEGGEAQEAATSVLGPGLNWILEQLLAPESGGLEAPSMTLMIRHAAGRIFQEAHYLALAPAQRDLFFSGQARPIGPASHSLGAFFTPTPLVRTLVEQALGDADWQSRPSVHIFDPACGSGEFLREAVRQLVMRGYRGRIRVTGYDVSAPACLMARFTLDAEMASSSAVLDVDISQRDALNGESWVSDVDVCLMNPPFISYRELTEVQRAAVVSTLGSLSGKRPDMAVAFLVLAVNSIGVQGSLGAVLPASVLDGDTAAPVREFITSRMTLKMTARLGNQSVFSDVTVDPALLVASRSTAGSVEQTTLVWADHKPGSSELALRALRRKKGSVGAALMEDTENFSIYTVPASSLRTDWAPRPFKSAQLLAALADKPKVGELFSVQQGTITGLNAAFVLNAEEYEGLPSSEKKWFRPAVVNDSIKAGRLTSSSWVFYPHGSDLPELASEDEVIRRLKSFYRLKLHPYREALIRRARVTESNWWRLSEYRSWQVERKPKIVSTYFGVAGAFALDATGAHVVVQGYGWVPKKGAFEERHLFALIAILNAPVTDTLLAGVSNNLGGGQWNLSKRYVERMPIVDPAKLSPALFEALADVGSAITAGHVVLPEQLDELAARAFGIELSNSI